jgi:hypothetical protein
MKIKLFIIALLPLVLAGCNDLFDKGDVEGVYDGPAVVGFFPLQQEVDLDDGEAVVEIQLIGEQRATDLPVAFTIGGENTTAVAGEHYTVISSPVTLSSGTSIANITIDLIEGSLDDGESVRLDLQLEGAEGVPPSENLRTATVFIRG